MELAMLNFNEYLALVGISSGSTSDSNGRMSRNPMPHKLTDCQKALKECVSIHVHQVLKFGGLHTDLVDKAKANGKVSDTSVQ